MFGKTILNAPAGDTDTVLDFAGILLDAGLVTILSPPGRCGSLTRDIGILASPLKKTCVMPFVAGIF